MGVSTIDFIFKVTVIGDGQVGKTSLIRRYTQASFQKQYIKTIGAQFSTYADKVDSLTCQLSLWDIAGQDDHFFLRPVFYKGTSCAIIVFSLEENDHGRESFKRVPIWQTEIRKFCGDIPIVLFGNKVDLVIEDALDDESVLKLVKKRGLLGYYKTSAKTGENVAEAFKNIISELLSQEKEN